MIKTLVVDDSGFFRRRIGEMKPIPYTLLRSRQYAQKIATTEERPPWARRP